MSKIIVFSKAKKKLADKETYVRDYGDRVLCDSDNTTQQTTCTCCDRLISRPSLRSV